MKWWQKLLLGLIRLFQLVTFKCKSDCCSCESECLRDNEEEMEEEVPQMKTDIGTTYSVVKEENIFDYANIIHKVD